MARTLLLSVRLKISAAHSALFIIGGLELLCSGILTLPCGQSRGSPHFRQLTLIVHSVARLLTLPEPSGNSLILAITAPSAFSMVPTSETWMVASSWPSHSRFELFCFVLLFFLLEVKAAVASNNTSASGRTFAISGSIICMAPVLAFAITVSAPAMIVSLSDGSCCLPFCCESRSSPIQSLLQVTFPACRMHLQVCRLPDTLHDSRCHNRCASICTIFPTHMCSF